MLRSLDSLYVIFLALSLAACSVVPRSLSEQERVNQFESDESTLQKLSYLGPDPILDVSDIIARAVVFNRDRELASLEARLAGLDNSQAYLDQLPSLTQRFNYSNRTNESGSTSADIVDGKVQPLDEEPSYSTSSPAESTSADLTLAFSVLDFGLAFKRAEQLAQQYLITQEKERQAVQSIYQRAQAAYWRAVAADRLEFELNALLLKTQDAYATSLEIERRNLRDPLQALTFRRELLDVERTLRDLKRDLATARTDLDVLIGVKPGTQYALRDALDPGYPMPASRPDRVSLETLALLNRSDIAQNLYQKRVLETERDSLLLQLLPSFNVNVSYNKDFSPYVLNDQYAGFGADLSWDFLNLLRVQPTRVRIDLRERLLEEQRLQITLAALALVQQSDELLNQNIDRFDLAQRYEEVTANVFMQVNAAAQSQRSGTLAVLKEELNFLVARHRSDLAYSDIQSAVSQVVEASGLDMVPDNWSELSINELASVIEHRRGAWFQPVQKASQSSASSLTVPVAPETVMPEKSPVELDAAAPMSEKVVVPPPESKPEFPALGVAPASLPLSRWAVQICSFKTREVVLKVQQELEASGWQDLYVVRQGRFYKLRHGGFDVRAVAVNAQQRLARENDFDGLVIRTSG